MDTFYEYMIQKKITKFTYLKIILLSILLAIITMGAILLFFAGNTLLGVSPLLVFLAWWGFIIVVREQRIEYEFILTNHELDIDVIRGKRRRKHITTINLKNVQFFAKKDEPKIKAALKVKAKEYYFVSDKLSENIYVTEVLSRKNNEKIRVFLEAVPELIEGIEKINPKIIRLTDF